MQESSKRPKNSFLRQVTKSTKKGERQPRTSERPGRPGRPSRDGCRGNGFRVAGGRGRGVDRGIDRRVNRARGEKHGDGRARSPTGGRLGLGRGRNGEHRGRVTARFRFPTVTLPVYGEGRKLRRRTSYEPLATFACRHSVEGRVVDTRRSAGLCEHCGIYDP